MSVYVRPVIGQTGARLAGGWCCFDRVEILRRGASPEMAGLEEVPPDVMERLTAPRPAIAGMAMDQPHVMAILNVTPDSFSDGGDYAGEGAVTEAMAMQDAGASIVDVGGESTRPGAAEVPVEDEVARVLPVVEALRGAVTVSVDTRKAAVAKAVRADLINDVAAFRFDPALAGVAADQGVPVCLMHSVATPDVMQRHADYDDVVLDVYDHLAERVAFAVGQGIARERIVVDPGIGFGKTTGHNLALLAHLSLFHGLGCPILLGASRKRFIGELGNAPDPKARLGGSVAVTLAGVRQGVQIHRVHDTFPHKQAIDLHMAMQGA